MSPFTPKNWQNLPSQATPLSAAALVDLETRTTGYTNDQMVLAEKIANRGIPNGYPSLNSDGFVPSNLLRPTVRNAQDFGAVGDGVHDDTLAIQNALDSLPSYTAGTGGGRVFLPQTTSRVYKTTSTLTLAGGRTICGEGMIGPMVQGDFAGPIINATEDFNAIETLFVRNINSNIAAKAFDVQAAVSHFLARRCYFNARCAGGPIGRIHGAYMAEISHCRFGGAFSNACDEGLLSDASGSGSNVLRINDSSFTDTKSGLIASNILTAKIVGNQFESNVGGGTYDAALGLSSIGGGIIMGNYFEATPSYPLGFFGFTNYSTGVVVGGNSFQSPSNDATGYIALNFARNCVVLPNTMYNSVAHPNPTIINNYGTYAHTNIVFEQEYQGTGNFTVGGIIRRAGNGSPEGVLKANVGSTYNRLDGGAGTSFYVKESGTGNTGWVAK